MMDLPTIVNIVLSVLSFILAAVSVWIALMTIRQNNKMIENATRPYVCVYGETINTGTPEFYIVLKNYGASVAIMSEFKSSFNDLNVYSIPNSRHYIEDFSTAVLAPGQSRICALDYKKIPDKTFISLKYSSGQKTYSDRFYINLKDGAAMPRHKTDSNENELRTISFTLQEMLQRSL